MSKCKDTLRMLGAGLMVAVFVAGCASGGAEPPAEETATTSPTTEPSATEAPTPTETPVPTPVGGGTGRIAFSSARGGNGSDIFVMDADGSNVAQLTFETGSVNSPAWSPDGSRIAVESTTSGGPNIWQISAECASLPEGCGSNLVQLTFNAAKDLNPAYSPDGSLIAFDSNLGGPLVTLAPGYQINAEDIYVMNADGSNVVRLTDHPDRDFNPVWSPDGSRIAFASRRDSNHDIYVMNAECVSLPEGCGSNLIRLTDGPGIDLSPDWSPDGSRIAFRDGDFNISVVNADGSGLVQLTDDPASEGDPAWSPDGSLIAFSSNRDGDYNIYVMNADGSNTVQLTDDPADDIRPAWEPAPSASSAPPAPADTSAPATTGGDLAPVEAVTIHVTNTDPLTVYAQPTGHLPNFCTKIGDWSQSRDGNTYTVTLYTVTENTAGCADSGEVSFGENIPLDVQGAASGQYTVSVNGVTSSFQVGGSSSAPQSSACGDGACSAGEDAATCPADCGQATSAGATCGNGIVEAGEQCEPGGSPCPDLVCEYESCGEGAQGSRICGHFTITFPSACNTSCTCYSEYSCDEPLPGT